MLFVSVFSSLLCLFDFTMGFCTFALYGFGFVAVVVVCVCVVRYGFF